jgi:hypothetical protein
MKPSSHWAAVRHPGGRFVVGRRDPDSKGETLLIRWDLGCLPFHLWP